MTFRSEKIWISDIDNGVYYFHPWFQATEYTRSDIADTLRAENARLREALEWYGVQVHTFATDQTGKADEADVVLDLDRGSRARAALSDVSS